ncbi:DUF167 domain-containing protein [Actinoalloteichus caeruleus]|uniref:DUF167 domain-containing protein n=1 Tax=Actinoalloteichus cyanogriseus TaxID=2893586 RepID=UPI00047D0680|nr:DUF167 domain-containing protein [Actinoalloteichus caeruleus]
MFRFAVRVKPGARRTVVGGRWDGVLGPALVVAVAAPAVEGKANEALRRAVADAFGVRRQAVRVDAGERGRDKWLVVDLDETAAEDRLRTLLEG